MPFGGKVLLITRKLSRPLHLVSKSSNLQSRLSQHRSENVVVFLVYPNVVHDPGDQLKAHVVLLRVLGIAEGGVLNGVEPRIGDHRLGSVPEVYLAGAEERECKEYAQWYYPAENVQGDG